MLFLKNKDDLYRILRSPALFSKEPVLLHLSELPPHEVISYETRINTLKKKNNKHIGIRIMLTSLAVLSCIYINVVYLPEHPLFPAPVLILWLSLCIGFTGMILHRFWIKKIAQAGSKTVAQTPLQAAGGSTVPGHVTIIGISAALK